MIQSVATIEGRFEIVGYGVHIHGRRMCREVFWDARVIGQLSLNHDEWLNVKTLQF